MPEFLSLSRMLDEAAKEPHPDWHDIRQGILRSFYDAARKRA